MKTSLVRLQRGTRALAHSSASTASLRLPTSALPTSLAACHAAFPVVHATRVEFRDLDPYSHVNNATYFSYFEEARMAAWPKGVEPKGIAPVLADVWCAFRRPVALYDVVHIGLRVDNVNVEASTFEHRYVVWSEALGQVAAQGGATVVLCDFDRQGRRATGLAPTDLERWGC